MKTLGRVLENNRNVGPGFDFLRVFLALSIVGYHALTVSGEWEAPYSFDDTPAWIIHYSLVPMFFALSGFLISGSAGRLSLKNFLINRGLRIVPALAVDTFVCALIIGPIFTQVSLGDYFSSRQFAAFLFNTIGWVHFTLPGVFEDHPVPQVNASLWTVPFELICYALISGVIVLRLVRTRYWVLGFVLAYLAASVAVQASNLPSLLQWQVHGHSAGRILSVIFIQREAQAVTAFLFGIILYQNRDRIPYSAALFWGSMLAVMAIAFGLSRDAGESAILRFVLIPALTYITVFVGLTPMPLPKFFRTGDYSYGIYLYHQPFLQIVVSLFPALALAPRAGAAFTLLAGLPFVLAVAWLSWHVIEKPLLALRKRFSIVAKLRGVGDASASAGHAEPGPPRLHDAPRGERV